MSAPQKQAMIRSRPPKQLLYALLGEFVVDRESLAVRTSVFLEVLEGAGVAVPAARATLDRLVQTGMLTRERRGRELEFSLTRAGRTFLNEATDRVRGPHPFGSRGDGWTLVTFSVPEEHRTLRHRLRATLAWEGFASLRDGLWLAPGAVDLAIALAPLREELRPGALLAFHAQELDGFPIEDGVRGAWDVDHIRRAHETFVDTWSDPDVIDAAGSAVVTRTMLVADWIELLSADPGLPSAYMGEDWPAERSVGVYRSLRAQLTPPSEVEFAALIAPRRAVAS